MTIYLLTKIETSGYGECYLRKFFTSMNKAISAGNLSAEKVMKWKLDFNTDKMVAHHNEAGFSYYIKAITVE